MLAPIRKFVRIGSTDDLRRPTGQGPRGLDRYTPHLVRPWQDGCRVAALLHEELKALGYRGSRRTVRLFVQRWRKTKPPLAVRRILPVRTRYAGSCCAAGLSSTRQNARS